MLSNNFSIEDRLHRASLLLLPQVLEMSQEDKETVRVRFEEVNDGGMVGCFLGLSLFMPLAHLHRPEGRTFLSVEVRMHRPCLTRRVTLTLLKRDYVRPPYQCRTSDYVSLPYHGKQSLMRLQGHRTKSNRHKCDYGRLPY